MSTGKRFRFIINVGYWVIIIAIVFAVFKYLLPLVMPFFIAFIFSAVLRVFINLLHKKLHIQHNIAAIFCVFIFYIIIALIVFALGAKIVSYISKAVSALPEFYTTTIEPGFLDLLAKIEEFALNISPESSALLDKTSESLLSSAGSLVTRVSTSAIGWVSSFATKLPGYIISGLICIIATVFLSMDFPMISAFITRQLPEKANDFVRSARHAIVNVVFRYGKSYFFVMLITFAELFIGLSLIGIKAALPMAILIAVVDIFPIVGSGLFLWPWAAILFVQGETGKGIGMVILYIAITCIRQFIEPKIVGGHVGLHPLVTLMCMFIGTSLFGGIGLFGLPILAATLKSLDDNGVIHIIKRDHHQISHESEEHK